ncbi:unnamed protein product [Penicillium olsonii]|nr:unnamed protein product [Penicillium olsonii]
MSTSRTPKRQRIYRACDQCRRRKSKCDGEQPSCSICRGADRSCTYENGGGRRGLAPGYVRSLETILGLVIQHVPKSESIVHELLAKSRNNDHFLTKDPATLWRKSRLAKELPLLLENESQDFSALITHEEPEWDTLDISNTPGLIAGDALPTTSELNDLAQPQATPKVNQIPSGILEQSFPTDTLDMLESYFKYTHSWFPIMEHHDLLRTMHTSTQSQTDPAKGSHLALWAIVAYEIFTNKSTDTTYPDHSQLQIAIFSGAMAQSSKLELGHIQALLILALLQLKLGDLSYAWRLSGLASRMLASLPSAAKKDRFQHTFHGCALLDNMTSALLRRTPCMSLMEQQEHGSINEDSMEEWTVWRVSSSRPEGPHRDQPQGPLRALSIFNKLGRLMEYLTRIINPSDNMTNTDACELLNILQAEQKLLIEKHPYSYSAACVNPPVLVLHLTCNFVILAHCNKIPQAMATTGDDLTGRLLQSTVDLLDLYAKITGIIRISPLLHCFALQCKQGLGTGLLNISPEQMGLVENRLSPYLPHLEAEVATCDETLFGTQAVDADISAGLSLAQKMDTAGDALPTVYVQPSEVQLSVQHALPTPANSIIPAPESPGLVSNYPPRENLFGETGVFDALFEEMVTSIPSNRREPTFARNLGFYAGDLDKDFLEQLQRPIDG